MSPETSVPSCVCVCARVCARVKYAMEILASSRLLTGASRGTGRRLGWAAVGPGVPGGARAWLQRYR